MRLGPAIADRRGVSEATGVAILVGLTVAATATVGLSVFVDDGTAEQGPAANFTYSFQDDSATLVVTHSGGDAFDAESLVLAGPYSEATWAALAGTNESTRVDQGSPVQLSAQSAYGEPVSRDHTVTVYLERDENRTELSQWNGG